MTSLDGIYSRIKCVSMGFEAFYESFIAVYLTAVPVLYNCSNTCGRNKQTYEWKRNV